MPIQVVLESESEARNPFRFIFLQYLIKFLPFFVWILPNGDSLSKKHSFLSQKTMFFCRKNYVFSPLNQRVAETKSRRAKFFLPFGRVNQAVIASKKRRNPYRALYYYGLPRPIGLARTYLFPDCFAFRSQGQTRTI